MNSSKRIKCIIFSYNSAGTILKPLLLPNQQFLLNCMQLGVGPEQKQLGDSCPLHDLYSPARLGHEYPKYCQACSPKGHQRALASWQTYVDFTKINMCTFKLKSAHARDSSASRQYKSNVFVFPHPEQHSAVHRGRTLRYPGQVGVRGDRTQTSQRTLTKGWTGSRKVALKHLWLCLIKSYINA